MPKSREYPDKIEYKKNLTFTQIIDMYCDVYDIEIVGYFKSKQGVAFIPMREIKIPHLTSLNNFIIALHEVAHIINAEKFENRPDYWIEYLTEKWAIKEAKKWGYTLESYEKEARFYVMLRMSETYNNGVPISSFPKEIIDWCQHDFSGWDGRLISIMYDKDKMVEKFEERR